MISDGLGPTWHPVLSLSVSKPISMNCHFIKDSDKKTNNDRMQREIRRFSAAIHFNLASLPRKQQMTQKKEMKKQDIEIGL